MTYCCAKTRYTPSNFCAKSICTKIPGCICCWRVWPRRTRNGSAVSVPGCMRVALSNLQWPHQHSGVHYLYNYRRELIVFELQTYAVVACLMRDCQSAAAFFLPFKLISKACLQLLQVLKWIVLWSYILWCFTFFLRLELLWQLYFNCIATRECPQEESGLWRRSVSLHVQNQLFRK